MLLVEIEMAKTWKERGGKGRRNSKKTRKIVVDGSHPKTC